MSLPSSMVDFVPCDHLLQKTYSLQKFAFKLLCVFNICLNLSRRAHVFFWNSELAYWVSVVLIHHKECFTFFKDLGRFCCLA